jgi:hypothetical protein
MYTLLNDTSTARLQMTAELQTEMNVLLNTYKHIEGDYESTLIGGVWHYLCDSGILTDAFSVNDRKIVDEKLAHLLEVEEDGYKVETDEWYIALHKMGELEFNKIRDAFTSMYDKYKVCDEDLARELRFMELDDNEK